MRPRALVVLNPAARRGAGARRYARVRGEVESRYRAEVVHTDLEGRWRAAVRAALDDGVRVFIAAGGDGTVHLLANALEEAGLPDGEVVLGAVGLGSSNDFHKPPGRVVRGVPLRIGLEGAGPRDLVRASWEGGSQVVVVSASLGLTAAANGFFNHPDAVLRRLKRWWVGAAILYAALRTLLRHRDAPAVLRVDGEAHPVDLTSLSVLETPWLSGSLRYDTPVDPASGRTRVNAACGLGRWGALRMLVALARGRFTGRPGARTWTARRLEVDLPEEGDLELDGEVLRAREICFEVLPGRVRACA